MRKRFLLAPGPTPIPEEVLLKMARPIIHHRTPEFSNILHEAEENLKYLFETTEDVLILASSGTGAMNGAISNLFSPSDHVLIVNGGKFGERWGKISEAYGLTTHWLNVEWGKPVDPREVSNILISNPQIRGVLVQASETSTTVAHPIEELAKITGKKDDCLLIVDGITAVGVFSVPMDKWGIDVMISGSQKALMLPPGLSFAALSKKAWRFAESASLPHFYFNFLKEKQSVAKNSSAFTPAVSLIVGMGEALKLIREEGLFNVHSRHARLANATRMAMQEIGLKLLAPKSPSNAATGVYLPDNIDGAAFVKYLRDEMGVTIAGGQEHLKGKIMRIAHLGYVDTFDVIVAVSAIEMALGIFGYGVRKGSGVAVAEEILVSGYEHIPHTLPTCKV